MQLHPSEKRVLCNCEIWSNLYFEEDCISFKANQINEISLTMCSILTVETFSFLHLIANAKTLLIQLQIHQITLAMEFEIWAYIDRIYKLRMQFYTK